MKKENKLMQKTNNPHLLVLITQQARQQEVDSAVDILLFLLRYTFLLTDTPPENNFSKRQFSTPGEFFFRNSNGARYLDPKYSRWLSTDPALTSYVEKNYEGPSGGIYNSVNLNLYHYGGNNPIKYVDPDGNDVINLTNDYILLRLEDSVIIPVFDKNGNRKIDHNGNKISIEIDTLVVKPGEYACGCFDGGKDKDGNYFKVTAKSGSVVSFMVTKSAIYVFDGGLLNSLGDVKKVFDNLLGKDHKETSGFKKAGSNGAEFLKSNWDESFNKDTGNSSWDDLYNTDEQISLRNYLNKKGPKSPIKLEVWE